MARQSVDPLFRIVELFEQPWKQLRDAELYMTYWRYRQEGYEEEEVI
jgi:hypothetical protein